ncbi:MORC family CW-type zinc finger protein [Sarotherodon galilaeus]
MDASNSTPHGLKSLLECLSRAALLVQPDDIPRFLCAHVENMIKFSDDEQLKDINEVIFRYQCQCEQTFFKDKRNWTETPRPCSEKFPISTSSALSASLVSSSPRKNSKSSVDAPSHHESVCPNTKEDQLHSRKQIRRPSGLPVLPTIRQKPSKPFQGQKSTKEYICSLADCHYKNKDTDSSPADQSLGSVSTDEGPTAQKDLGLQNLKAKPGPSVIHVPYRPKGGYIVDPELQPKRGRAGPFTNRGALLFGRKSNVLEGLNVWNNPELLLVSQSVP